MAGELLQAAVYYADDDERDAAVRVLGEVMPNAVEEFNGVVQGWATPTRLEELVGLGLTLHLSDPRAVRETSLLDLVAEPTIIEGLKRSTLSAMLAPGGGLAVADGPVDERDRRIHAFGEYDAAPDPQAGLEADVYFLRLVSPITEAQRLELYHEYGVDVGAFLPPDRYRTFLTHLQHEAVRRLRYVRDVVRYRFEDTVTRELVAALTDAEAAGSTRTFDCLLHRERDLPDIRALIEATDGTEVVGSSNLRIRFMSPLSPPLLAALAALPEVRKLSPYEAPAL